MHVCMRKEEEGIEGVDERAWNTCSKRDRIYKQEREMEVEEWKGVGSHGRFQR